MHSKWPDWPNPEDRLSLSWLSYGTYVRCQRSWFYSYNTDLIEGEERWEFLRAKRLMPKNTLVGRVVDDAISIGLLKLRQAGSLPDLKQLARELFADYLRYTHDWMAALAERKPWPKSLCQPIDHIYYREPFTASEKSKMLEKANSCLDNFVASKIIEEIQQYDVTAWQLSSRKLEEPPPWFWYDGFPVYSKYDFAIKTSNSAIIYDWKTGNPVYGEDAAVEQLHWYALYAMIEWQVPMENILLVPVWLSAGSSYYPSKVEPERIQRVSADWTNRIELLRSIRIACSGALTKVIESFPMTEDLRICKSCVFRACPGWVRSKEPVSATNVSDVEPDPLTTE